MPLRRRIPLSLRTELLINFGFLVAAALVVLVASVVLFLEVLADARTPFVLGGLIAADVLVFVLFGGRLLRALVLHPLAEAVAATRAIAAGDLDRRVPRGATAELAELADSVNHLTDSLLIERAQLVRAEKLAVVGRLAAGIAHELGNPLGAVNGYVHLLRQRLNGDANAAGALDAIERETERVDRIVRGLLEYARPRRTPAAPVEVNDTIEGVVTLLEAQGALQRVQLRVELPSPPARLAGQRHELEQVFVNLLLNALDAVPDGGTIVVHARRASAELLLTGSERRAADPSGTRFSRVPNQRVRTWLGAAPPDAPLVQIVVADSGVGIPEAVVERIFDPFFTTKAPGKGTGLGLAIVARIVDAMSGIIWAQRAREGGAAFVLVFPEAVAQAPAAALPAGEPRRSVPA